jgi:YD repeat-containing protein
MTYDVLGRLLKTEVLNWDQSVYSTTTNTYNARDQITQVLEQQGASGSGQQTTFTYDGHGRLQTRRLPIETASCSYIYNADDTLQKKIDPRGASATYTYNNRHLVTGITYAKPAGQEPEHDINAIPNVTPVGFGYDEAGNRLWMTDGVGRVDYTYDTWSRMASETRQFTGLSGSFRISYGYNLAGQLMSITDPFNSTVSYSRNHGGQLTAVTGTGYPGVTQFVTGMQYRAWGTLKRATYGDNNTATFSYNGRMLLTRFAVSQFRGSDVEYHPDGRVRMARDLGNSEFDRAYNYDQVGRIIQGLTGTEARGGTTADGPYKQAYQYDAWDNLIVRTTRFWSQSEGSYTATYVNDRNAAWNYNASGQVTRDTLQHTYDAAGRKVKAEDIAFNGAQLTIEQVYDGDGQVGKRREARPGLDRTIYTVRSTVLGGQVIGELNTAGQNHRRYVYAGVEEIAEHDGFTNHVIFTHRNPVTGSENDLETDPLGGYVGFSDPFLKNPNADYAEIKGEAPLYLEDGNPFDPGSGCTLDGIPVACDVAARMAGNGGAVVAPVRSVAPVYDPSSNSFVGFGFFNPNASSGDEWVYTYRSYDTGRGTLPNGTIHMGTLDVLIRVRPAGFLGGQRLRLEHPATERAKIERERIDSILRNNIRIVDAGGDTGLEKNKSQALNRIAYMVRSNDCAQAFRRAGLKTPLELIEKGLLLAPRRTLTDPAYNKVLGIGEDVRRIANTSTQPAQTIQARFTTTGIPIIVIASDAFVGDYLEDAVPHEFIHVAGIGNMPQTFLGIPNPFAHDLKGYKYFEDILKNCKQ